MPRTRHALAVCTALAVGIVTGCGGGGGGGSTTSAGNADTVSAGSDAAFADGGTLTFGLASDPGGLDPSTTPSSVARSMLSLSYDTLIYQRADGEIVSGLAQRWDATSPTTVTFTLRDGITCSDGSDLTATDVADNIRFIADPDNGSPLTGVSVPAGAKAEADDAARTVTVTAPSADGFLLNEIGGVFIICRAGLDDHEKLDKATLGTGPWVLRSASPGDRYRFEPRDGYAWGPDGQRLEGEGVPDAVEARVVENSSTTANLLLSGELNVADVNGPDAARLAGARLPTIDGVDTSGETWFNHAKRSPASDPAVREALTLGADRAAVGKVATGDDDQPSKGFITLQPNPCAGTDTVGDRLPAPDAAKAAQVLDDAGWTAGSGGVRSKNGRRLQIDFVYDKKGLDARGAGTELLADQWKELGVDVRLRALPEAQLNQLLFQTGAWDVAWANFTFNLPSQMVAFVSGPTIPDGANFPAVDNADYERLTAKAIGQVADAGCPTWAQAEQALLSSFDVVPMFDSINRTWVKDAQLTSVGGQVWGSSLRLLQG